MGNALQLVLGVWKINICVIFRHVSEEKKEKENSETNSNLSSRV